jgi:hydroxypyruvate isomerase
MKNSKINRRQAMTAAGVLAVAPAVHAFDTERPKGNLKQSVCRWCYGKIPLEKLAEESKRIGYQSIEILPPNEVLTVQKLGLTCAVLHMGGAINIGNCLNRPANHDKIEATLIEGIDFAAEHKLPNVICFSGNRNKMDDDEGLKNCAAGLKRVVGHAEKKGVTIVMELLNSKVDHKDYMCDRTPWGVRLVNAVGSPRFKLLYDIYHMQIMEGDVIRTIQDHKDAIAHYHTGGVPGRAEIDATQELNYTAICQAILKTGYTGYLAQEFIPRRDPLTSLAEAFGICDV